MVSDATSSSDTSRELVARWTRVGAAFNVLPAAETPDLEQLLIDTVRCQPLEARLFIMALTWLCRYSHLVARHRLRALAIAQLSPGERSILGLLFDLVQQHTGFTRFHDLINVCPPRSRPAPLFAAASADPAIADRVRRRASDIAMRWNLWVEPLELKFDALRPAQWVIQHNAPFAVRERFAGDLRASIIETLRCTPGAGRSELELARHCSATRPALRAALARLAAAGVIERIRTGNRLGIRLRTSEPGTPG